MPPPLQPPIKAANGQEDERWNRTYPPIKYKNYLACPFPKHDPDIYITVNNVCTERWGFKDIGALNEHIQRVHSLEFGCIICKSRFTQSKAAAKQAKLNHKCKRRDLTVEHPQWMDEGQEARLANWKEPGKAQEGGAKSWVKIYMCLFETAESDVPSPYYDFLVPKHLVPTSSANDIYPLPVDSYTVDPSLLYRVSNEAQETGNLRPLEHQQESRLDPGALDKYQDGDKHPYNWIVKQAKDSGYDTQEPQEGDQSFSESSCPPRISDFRHPSADVMFATGNSDQDADLTNPLWLSLDI